MQDDRPLSLELAKELQSTKEQLRITTSELSQIRAEFRDLLRQVMSSENERSIISQMWQMRQTITDLRREVDEQHKVKQSRGDKSWQIITIVLAATVSVAIGLVPKLLEERTPPDPWQSSSTNLNT